MALIEVSQVDKSFKDIHAVDHIDLSINKGEYVALLGPNGAGKTTLVEMIEGIQKPDSGNIRINGLEWKGNEDQLHRMIGLSLQETYFIDKLKVEETLKLFASFYGLNSNGIDEVTELVNLQSKKRSNVENLSGGQKQKLALAVALLNKPKILLLDEPTTGLDPTARREIWDILTHLKVNYDTTMILTTHYMEEASYLCDRIVILDQGKVLARGTLDSLIENHLSGEIIEFSVPGGFDIEKLPDQHEIKSQKYDQNRNRWRLVVDDLVTYLPKVQHAVSQEGQSLDSLECRKMTLDDLFISMTGRHLDD